MKAKKCKRIIALILIIGVLCSFFAVQVSAASFSFSFPSSDYTTGSMRWSSALTRAASSDSAYVKTSKATISTLYFLSPWNGSTNSSTNATDIKYITSISTKYFTFKSGYGGAGQAYKLAGCPNISNGTWDAYSSTGTFDL